MNDDTLSCQWCFATVMDYDLHAHTRWHKANHLHAAGCAALVIPKDSRDIKACDCGLRNA